MATDPFAAALTAIFASPMATWADYTPKGRPTVRIRVIRDQASQEASLGQGSVILDGNSVQFKRADAPLAPTDGEALTILQLDLTGNILAQDHFALQGDGELDVEGITWRCGMITVDPVSLQGAVIAQATVTGTLSGAAYLLGVVSAQAIVTGGISGTATLVGSVSAQATITGNLTGPFDGYTIAWDFKNGIYRSVNTLAATPSLLPGYSYARAGAKSELDAGGTPTAFGVNVPAVVAGVGYWARGANTNILLNAGSAATLAGQSVTVTAQQYTLSFIGTGTVTLSGASTAGPLVGTGTSNRVSLTFTPTAGTLTLSVSGSVTFAGLVAGALPGPIIATAGAAATAALDDMRFSQPIPVDEDWVLWVVATVSVGAGNDLLSITDGTANNRVMLYVQAGGNLSGRVSVAGANLYNLGVGVSLSGRVAIALRRRSGKYTLATKAADLTVTKSTETAAIAFPAVLNRIDVGNLLGTASANGPLEFVGFKRATLSDADLTALITAA
jgi:hypothetical protein